MEDKKKYGFFAMLDRMQYINRWGLMMNNRFENIKEHSFDVAVIAHALAVIHNSLCDKGEESTKVDPNMVQSYALYHDCTEIITGDLPTPIKYRNETIKKAYKEVEHEAAERLVSHLPSEMASEYMDLLDPRYDDPSFENGELVGRLVKAADKISAYIKCITEEASGNREFSSAKKSTEKSIRKMGIRAADIFMENFVPTYGYTLDQINENK